MRNVYEEENIFNFIRLISLILAVCNEPKEIKPIDNQNAYNKFHIKRSQSAGIYKFLFTTCVYSFLFCLSKVWGKFSLMPFLDINR